MTLMSINDVDEMNDWPEEIEDIDSNIDPGKTLTPDVARSILGRRTQLLGKDSFEAYIARQDLIEANIAKAIQKHRVAGMPLRDEAKRRLIELLDN